MQLELVAVTKDEDMNVIIGQTHFIKSVEDIYEAVVNAVPGVKFGLAFNEASGVSLVRCAGTDDHLTALARSNALAIGAGHIFVLLLGNGYPSTCSMLSRRCRRCARSSPRRRTRSRSSSQMTKPAAVSWASSTAKSRGVWRVKVTQGTERRYCDGSATNSEAACSPRTSAGGSASSTGIAWLGLAGSLQRGLDARIPWMRG